MNYVTEKLVKKFVIGIEVKTSNEDGRFLKDTMPLWEKFYAESVLEKIPHRVNHDLLAVYTDYEGDYTQPFTFLIGCEVTNLNTIPAGMRGVEISAASYAVFTAQGEFPQSIGQAWHTIWNSEVRRSYTSDFEVYPYDFNPQTNPEVNIYISTTVFGE